MTMQQLFPDAMARMKLARVILRLRKPELKSMPPNVPLPPELLAQVQGALREIEAG